MKKRISRLFLLLATLTVLVLAVSVSASATNYVNVNKGTLTAGQWTTLAPQSSGYVGDTYTIYYNWYKISVPADGKLVLSVAKASGSDGYSLEIDNASKTKSVVYPSSSSNSGTYIYALSSGTYYIRSCYSNSRYTKVKYTFTKANNGTNYCLAKATSLSKNKAIGVCSTSHYSYDRWYKITMTSAGYLHLASKYWSGDSSYTNSSLYVYDKNGEQVYMSSMSYGKISQETLSKGTYYIRLKDQGYYNLYRGYYTNLKWY